MTTDQAYLKQKKTDETTNSTDNDEEVPIKFTFLDILRILGGLVLLYSIFCRIFLGRWIYCGSSRSKSQILRDELSIPNYWLTRSAGQIPMAFTFDDLAKYSGENDSERILLSIKGHVFDVTRGSRFYGKWGAYRKFTGTDCSKSFSYPQWDMSALTKKCSSDLSGSTLTELKRVDSWLQFFQKKYPEIGYVRELQADSA